MEVTEFMDRLRALPSWKQNFIVLSAISHIHAGKELGYESSKRTWGRLNRDLSKMENFEVTE